MINNILNPSVLTVCACAISTLAMFKLYKKHKDNQLRRRWDTVEKDVVVLHQFKRGKCCPNLSPFALKVETFLRLADIKYIVDSDKPFGNKGKCPWISLNGEEVADSEFAIQRLKSHFNVKIDDRLTEKEAASLEALRIMVDEHLFWCAVLWRYAYDKSTSFLTTQEANFTFRFVMKHILPRSMEKRAKVQGMGRHSQEEVYAIAENDVKILSTVLGDSDFFGGSSPCTFDCSLFGMLAQCMWNSPDSFFERLVKDTYKNLGEYCLRMKQRVFPDWEDLLVK